MQFIHVRNLDKYHPGYKDRQLQWAKIHFQMAQGDPDCEMITDEIDWARLIKFILLELQAKKPIPLDDEYLRKKGFNLKKRPILLTLNMLQNFIVIVDEDEKLCAIDKDKEEDKEIDKDKETGTELIVTEEPFRFADPEFELAWNEWIKFREEIKKKLTPTSVKQQLAFLSKQKNPAACIRQSIQNGWQGLFEIKENKGFFNGFGNSKKSRGVVTREEVEDELSRAFKN
jgi:hypothetical protein